MIPVTITIPILVVGASLVAGTSFYGGWTVRDWKAAEEEVARVEATTKKKDENLEQVQVASTNYEKKGIERETVYKTVYKTVKVVVDRPVYRNVCLDDDGVLSLNKAIDPGYSGSPTLKSSDSLQEVRLPRREDR